MKLIIIKGPSGVGKSTVGKLIHNQLKNSAYLDGDDVWRINPFEVNDKTKNIVEKNIPFVLNSYIEAGYQHVILSWVLHKQSIIDRLLSRLNILNSEVYVFALIADENTISNRIKSDFYTQRNLGLVKDRLKQPIETQNIKIDTTGLNPEQITKIILDSIVQ